MQSLNKYKMGEFEKNGFTALKNIISQENTLLIQQAISRIIWRTAEEVGGDCFEKMKNILEEDIPHQGLLVLRETGSEYMRIAVDRMRCSSLILEQIYSPAFRKLLYKFMGASSSDDIALGWDMVRADLPQEFSSEEANFSLPWHQESAYYKHQVSAKSSIVIWIPVFDCPINHGCMELLKGSHKLGVVSHDAKYLDLKNNRNLRYYAQGTFEDKYESIHAERK